MKIVCGCSAIDWRDYRIYASKEKWYFRCDIGTCNQRRIDHDDDDDDRKNNNNNNNNTIMRRGSCVFGRRK